jgi:hypothetical protein
MRSAIDFRRSAIDFRRSAAFGLAAFHSSFVICPFVIRLTALFILNPAASP